jgi:hypothetical protein
LKSKIIDGYKLWHSDQVKDKNGVGIILDSDLKEEVVDVKRFGDRVIIAKLLIGGKPFNVVSAYAPFPPRSYCQLRSSKSFGVTSIDYSRASFLKKASCWRTSLMAIWGRKRRATIRARVALGTVREIKRVRPFWILP